MSSAGETDTNTASKPAPVFGVTISNTANKNNINGNAVGSAFGGFVSSSLTSGAGGGGGSGGNGMTTTTTSVFGSSAAPKVVPITPLSDTTPRKPSVFGDTASVWLPQTPPPEKKQPQAASTASATTTSVFGGKGGVAAPAARPFGSGVFGVTPSSSMSTTQQQQQKESDTTTTTKAKPVVTSTDILSMSAIPAKASVAAAVADVSAVAGTAPPPPTSSVSSTTLFKSDIFNKDDSTKAFVKASISGTSSRTGFAVASSSSSSSFMGGGVKPGSTVSSSRAQSQQQEGRDFSSSSSPREKDDDNDVDHEEAAVVASSSVLHPIAIFNESVLTRMHQLQQLTTAADELLAWNEVTTLRRETLDDLEAIALQAERELDECEAALNAVEKLDANLFRTASQTKSNTRGQQHLLLPQASMSSSGAQGRMWREYRDAFAVAFKKHNGRYEELSKRSKTLRALQQE